MVSVNAGFVNDPSDRLGLSELTLQSLFKRSSKYPEKDGFKKFCESKNLFFSPCNDQTTHSINVTLEHADRDEYLDRLVSCFEFPMFLDEDIEEALKRFDEVYAENCEDNFRY